MNIFYSMQRNVKLRNKSQHHITILTLLFWVWKPSEKPKMGKLVQQSDRFYYEKIWNFYNHWKFTQTWKMQYPAESLGKSKLNLNTLLCEFTTQLFEAR